MEDDVLKRFLLGKIMCLIDFPAFFPLKDNVQFFQAIYSGIGQRVSKISQPKKRLNKKIRGTVVLGQIVCRAHTQHLPILFAGLVAVSDGWHFLQIFHSEHKANYPKCHSHIG